MLSYDQAAAELGISARTLRKMTAAGEITSGRVRGSVRLEPEALRSYVDAHRVETRMSDVSSSVTGNNDFGGYAKDLGVSAASPGTGASAESGVAGGGASWQSWQPADPFAESEPVRPAGGPPGMVSGGVVAYGPEGADPWPGVRPAGSQGEISPTVPDWAVDRAPADYDVAPDPAAHEPSRPWRANTRPSDMPAGSTQAFPGGGQIPSGAVDSTGETGPRRLRRDDSSGGVLP